MPNASPPNESPIIVWFRRDLRLSDNPALHRAVQSGKPVIALYILETDIGRHLGGASAWWLHHSLASLAAGLKSVGAALHIRKGKAHEELQALIKAAGAQHVVWNRRYAKEDRDRDALIKQNLTSQGITTETFRANLLSEPWEIETKTGGYYKVFTPYWRAATAKFNIAPAIKSPAHITAYTGLSGGLDLDELALLPASPDWGEKLGPYWQAGEDGAAKSLKDFLSGPVETYTDDRNRPDIKNGTSKLSPHLAHGEISPRQIWEACQDNPETARKFLSEIGWREFSYVLLFHNPALRSENFKPSFDAFEWEKNPSALQAWQKGQTGYPFVDAGMRQLWQTGWQHNRVRMVTASFLIKHLLIDWREGEKWFHDTLVDYDPASNAASWQWVAGSGADASPYFRIFNPFTQGEKFDPNADYVRAFVPELKHLPNKYIHRPWDAPDAVLKAAGVTLGVTYPRPIVNHKDAREAAMAAYKRTKS